MTNDTQQIELDIEEARKMVELHNAYLRLKKNTDFQLIIEDNFFKGEAARLVEFKANPAVQSTEMQAQICKAMDAIGGLQQYFNKLGYQAENAERAIEDGNEALAEMNAEELEA